MWLVHIWWWIQEVVGINIGVAGHTPRWYNFWSGFGSDLGEVTIIVGIVAWYKAGECHVDKCHRRGKHPFKHYKLCAKHHPNVPDKVTQLHIKSLHKRDKLEI